MQRRRGVRTACLAFATTFLLPAASAAQTGSIAGSVTDETGGVLPGVTVEARSPALIEGVRTSISDGAGLYAIEALRPGTYSVTFTLPGFSTFVREGIELSSGFAANVDAQMTVGSIEETVTVSGASPIIDVQNVTTQDTFTRERFDALPTGKTYWGYAALTPGATSEILGGGHDVGGSIGDTWGHIKIHGSDDTDGDIKWDGFYFTNGIGTGTGTSRLYFPNQAAIQETVMTIAAMDAESRTGGVGVNSIPKEGGNQFSYYVNMSGTNEHMQNLNWDEELGRRGMLERQVNGIRKIWDYGIGVGGPIVRDRLWFYTAHRWWGSQSYQPSSFVNLTPHSSIYTPDYDQPVDFDIHQRDNSLRLTWQASERHKFNFSRSDQSSCFCNFWSQYGFVDKDASALYTFDPVNLSQASWTMPVTNRLLFQAGASMLKTRASPKLQPTVRPDDVGIRTFTPFFFVHNTQVVCDATPCLYGEEQHPNFSSRASVSYVTGSHNLKVGYSHLWLREAHLNVYIHNDLSYDFVAPGVSFGVNQYATPRLSDQRAHEVAVFAQDQWTIDRLTLNLGVRWDHLNGYIPEQTHPQGRFTDSFTVAAIDGAPYYHDIAPRVGAAYDLFGDGRTAIKGSFGRYVLGIGTNIAQDVNPMESFSVQASRPWNDNLFPFLGLPPGNGDLNPDCDFDNFEANGECGAIRDPNFGTPVIVNRYRDDLLRGWGTRQGQWQTSFAVQHELAEGWTIEVGYYRTKFDGFTVIDNLNVTPDDYGEYCITAPTDPGLRSVSGTQLCNLWTITQAGLDRGEDLVTVPASDFGDKWMDFNGVDFNFSGRLPNGATLAGGLTTGSQTWSECFVVDNPTQNRPGYCQVSEPWLAGTQFKINGSYPLPYDTEVSFVYQNIAGILHEAEYDALADPAERAFAEAMLGRPVAVGEENVQLLPAGTGFFTSYPTTSAAVASQTFNTISTQHEPRLNQLDLRFTKIINFGGARVRAWFDIFNIFNANYVSFVDDNYADNFPRITQIMNGRLFKVGGQYDW